MEEHIWLQSPFLEQPAVPWNYLQNNGPRPLPPPLIGMTTAQMMGHVLIVDDDPALRPMMTEYFVNPDHSASLGDSSLSPWIRFSIHTGMDQVL